MAKEHRMVLQNRAHQRHDDMSLPLARRERGHSCSTNGAGVGQRDTPKTLYPGRWTLASNSTRALGHA